MASWMVHLRVADELLRQLPDLTETEFIVGSIAPDSGVPNEDWSVFTPSTRISHFKTDEKGKNINISQFIRQYFTPEMQQAYTREQHSFYLGYLTHLMTDLQWSARVARPCTDAHREEYEADKTSFIWKIKEDWYDLDFLYLRDNPDFRAYRVYQNAVGFQNTYMEIFPADAFDNRREYITGFYSETRDDLDRIYPYLTKEASARFVEDCVCAILDELRNYMA